MSAFTESVVEEAALEWFAELGYAVVGGPAIAPGEPGEERRSYAAVVLEGRLHEALARLNPGVSREGLDEAFRKLTRISSPQPLDANHELHDYVVNGVSVEYLRTDGSIGYDPVRVVDFEAPDKNDWLVVNQLTIAEGGHTRRPDVVVFLNGLPIAVLELKNAASGNATVWNAFQQLQTYKDELPSLFVFNELLVVSDGLEARIGTLSSNRERFLPWRTIEGGSARAENSFAARGSPSRRLSTRDGCSICSAISSSSKTMATSSSKRWPATTSSTRSRARWRRRSRRHVRREIGASVSSGIRRGPARA